MSYDPFDNAHNPASPDYNYGGAALRLRALELALERPDGAAVPPLNEVIERAQAYWRFILKGE